ncbi:hypothetical protein P167DRAFT_543632 [Morchella conica CCBAS932]|uniref:RlpA-like protein double-psi beta-barrel domain-containing protein n=1 Tax=Morchella conica CCBAS932 TaxID=1392247 RepID=A0A3N4L1N2_9PEZI|nr:hypothetical protein P167DRAFT_543632 [Morchella conica CCBAS932]
MKFSTTTLGFVLSLSAVMAAPLKERAVEVATVTETYTKVVHETAVVWVPPPAKSEHPAAYSAKQYGYEPSSITTTHETVVETSTPVSSIPSTLSTSSTSSFSSSSLSSSSTESTTSSSTESTSTEATTTTESTSTESTSTEATSTTSTTTEATSTSTTSTAESTTSTTAEPTTSTTSQEPTTSSTSVSIPSTTIEASTTAVIPSFTPLSIPTTTQPAATSAVAKAVESAVSSGSGSGMYAGQMTYYTPGLGSCGETSGEGDYIVAAAWQYMWEGYGSSLNPNKNPKCGQKVMMTGPKGKQVPATIVDTCPGCNGKYDLDCTLVLFKELGCTEADGRCQMTWSPM